MASIMGSLRMTNSKRRCKFCKNYFSTWVEYPAGVFCSIDHALAFAQQPKQREAAFKAKTNERKKALLDNDRGHFLKKAQEAFNRFIRLRDADMPCVSCGRHHTGQYHAGHYRTAGAAPELRFDPMNCHKQCAPCNNHKSGNLTEYRIELVRRIGIDGVAYLEGPHEPKKYTIDELKEIAQRYKIAAKNLEDNGL